ncbi:hypothetical protein BDV95DRAFT_590584 [Massariosphaeria phaeospora]|uniref:Uncharacterized protein n=1 Tax=Massariosphaeria phaeospora TaxID=100035 RepID=A0A7C8IHG8_9PLEO|nr:hypothetical protein BDV95DRAFT_590584 [Massariosphaeria phaeospora]
MYRKAFGAWSQNTERRRRTSSIRIPNYTASKPISWTEPKLSIVFHATLRLHNLSELGRMLTCRGIPPPDRVPDCATFRINTMGSYNITFEPGIKEITLASSFTTYGITYADGDVDYPSSPSDEKTSTNPMDV